MNDLTGKFKDLDDFLSGNQFVNLFKFNIEPPLSAKDLKAVESEYKVQLTGETLDFYTQCNGIRIKWRLATEDLPGSPDDEITGSINILPLNEVFGGFDGNRWHDDFWTDDTPAGQKRKLQQLRPFDYFYQEDSAFTGFTQKDRELPDQLFLHSTDFGVHDTGIGVDTYLELLLQTGGFDSWPFLILKKRAADYDYEKLEADFIKYMPVIFPDFNYDDFKKLSHVKK